MIGMTHRSIAERVADELASAHKERGRGNEGRARVCARRAAGWAIGAHFARLTGAKPPRSVLSLLHWLHQRTDIDEEIRNAAMRLTIHVTPSHDLPFDEDPLVDAQCIVNAFAAGDK
jgi:HEPN domain-containing protein